MRIMLVEDDKSLREGIAFKLRREGYDVDTAGSVAEAEALLSRAYDLAILDVGLPDGSGLSVCSMIRKRQPKAHVLLLSAQDTELDMVLGYERGGDDYMVKPFSLSVLMAKVSAIERCAGGNTTMAGPIRWMPRGRRRGWVSGQDAG